MIERIPLDDALIELGDPDLKSIKELMAFTLSVNFATTVKLNEVIDHINKEGK